VLKGVYCFLCLVSKCIMKSVAVWHAGRPVGQVTFMVDFFEHCQLSNDVEFGGNDVLQVYNTAQVKHRLNTTGMYIASTKVLSCTLHSNITMFMHLGIIFLLRVLIFSFSDL